MLQSVLSPTHFSHTTLLRPFEIKWEVYFSAEVCSFVIIVDYVSAYIYVYILLYHGYTAETRNHYSPKVSEPLAALIFLFSFWACKSRRKGTIDTTCELVSSFNLEPANLVPLNGSVAFLWHSYSSPWISRHQRTRIKKPSFFYRGS